MNQDHRAVASTSPAAAGYLNVRRQNVKPLVSISAAKAKKPGAALDALLSFLGSHPADRKTPEVRALWLATTYAAQVDNGGHLQYFHNIGISAAPDTLAALRLLGAERHAALLDTCCTMVRLASVPKAKSLERYAELARERRFEVQDREFYELKPDIHMLASNYLATHLSHLIEVKANSRGARKPKP
jgi:hypothetical protein